MLDRTARAFGGVLLAALTACQSADPYIVVEGQELRPRPYSLVLQRLAPGAAGLRESAPSVGDATRAHLDYIDGLEQDGTLALAGPFGSVKHDDSLRGLMVLDESDASKARALADSDPLAAAGVYEAEVLPLLTLDVLRFVPELERRARRGAPVEGADAGRGSVLRSYCAVFADDGESVSRLLDGEVLGPKVALMGRLGGARDGALFAILDIEEPSLVRPYLLAASGGHEVPGVELSQLFATPALHELLVEGPPAAETAPE